MNTTELPFQTLEEVNDLKQEFHAYWLENGEPHPSSNAYLDMTRAFFYVKGFEAGTKMEKRYGGSDV